MDPELELLLNHRHPSTRLICRYFTYGHLRDGPLREASQECTDLVKVMLRLLPDGPELTTGLRKLLEAKDCFVRAALDL